MNITGSSSDLVTASFKNDGFAVLPAYLDPELLKQLQAHTDRLMHSPTASAGASELIDYEPVRLNGEAVIQRIRKPYLLDDFFFELARSEQILSLLRPVIGQDIRLHHGKINVKAPQVGSPLEWHQDWAFIPHSNQSMAIVSILIDDCTSIKGPLQYLPGSHLGPLHPHHHDGLFVGAIDSAILNLGGAQQAIGPAGTVTVHHPMTVHGSGLNNGESARRMIFFEYAAADAWPLFYGVEWADFSARMMCGEPTTTMRFTETEVRMPFPNGSEGQGRIYDLQQSFQKRYFDIPGQVS